MNQKLFMIIGVVVVIYLIAFIFFLWMKKSSNKKWLKDNKNMSKIYVKGGGGQLFVTAIDDEKTRTFVEGVKHGVYISAGEHILEVLYQSIRPGVLHKTVTTTYGPSKLKVQIAADTNYELHFNLGNKNFVFFEMGAQAEMEARAAKKLEAVKVNIDSFARIYNYINIDSIDDKGIEEYPVELSKTRKGKKAPYVEIIYIAGGEHAVIAHGTTFQTEPVALTVHLEAGKYYCLGASKDEVYMEERPMDWTKDK